MTVTLLGQPTMTQSEERTWIRWAEAGLLRQALDLEAADYAVALRKYALKYGSEREK